MKLVYPFMNLPYKSRLVYCILIYLFIPTMPLSSDLLLFILATDCLLQSINRRSTEKRRFQIGKSV
jgi:hypothetical protein